MAGASNLAMTTGLYPLVPSASACLMNRHSGRSSTLSLRSAATEWGSGVAAVIARPAGFLGAQLTPDRGQRPVILVHGYAMNRACFRVLAHRLAAAGFGPIYGFEYWSLGKVSSASRKLHAFTEEVAERHGHEQVDLVGHSMGGLVCRYYLSLGPGRNRHRVAHLITVGTPHGGTNFSAFGIGRAQVELRPKTPFFVRMATAALPESTQITVIWSRADALVGSSDYASWPGCDEVVYDDLGHVSLLFSRRVAAVISDRLLALPTKP